VAAEVHSGPGALAGGWRLAGRAERPPAARSPVAR